MIKIIHGLNIRLQANQEFLNYNNLCIRNMMVVVILKNLTGIYRMSEKKIFNKLLKLFNL